MVLIYENEKGSLMLGGKGNPWRLTDSSGFGLPEKSYQRAEYITRPGRVTLREKAESRVMTLRGDFAGSVSEISKAMGILNVPGVLSIYHGERVRRINAYCTHCEFLKKKGVYREFVLQFTADNPYFEGEKALVVPLFLRVDKVSGSFALPCIFTERFFDITIKNGGAVRTEPVFVISCVKKNGDEPEAIIRLENRSTAKVFQLNYAMEEGETIVVDIGGRRVTSDRKTEENNDGNLLYFLSEDTFLHQLYLEQGENDFSFSTDNSDTEYAVQCRFKELFLEAVI